MQAKSNNTSQIPSLLLHTCCAPCSAPVCERLQQQYRITLFYFNPNTHPPREYRLRLEELQRFATAQKLPLLALDYHPAAWFAAIRGWEQEPEKGHRCTLCYRLRLTAAAQQANAGGWDYFTTVLSLSPHKDAQRINAIGSQLAEQGGSRFLPANFKKQGGMQRSSELSRYYGFYRQNYCGCIFSLRQRWQKQGFEVNGQESFA